MNPQPKDQLNVIRIIHLALMGGVVIFAIVAAFLVLDGRSLEGIEILNYASPALFVVIAIAQSQMFKITIKPALSDEIPLSSKLATYQTANVIRMALLEGCGLLATVTMLVNTEILHLITVALVLGLMFTKIPTPSLLEAELGLSREEKDQLTKE